MPTGSFPADFAVNHYRFASQSLNNGPNIPLYAQLYYPIGYSGSVILNPTPFPTASISGSGSVVVPTVGQLWPRGNRTTI